MKFTADIASQLRSIVSFISASSHARDHEITKAIHLIADMDRQSVTVRATSLDRFISYTVSADVSQSGEAWYTGADLVSLIKKNKSRYPGAMSFASGSVSCGVQQTLKLIPDVKPIEFPSIANVAGDGWSSIAVSELAKAVNSVGHAVSDDPTRQVLTGIRFDGNATACDGHVLSTIKTSFEPATPFTIPASVFKDKSDKKDLFSLLAALGRNQVDIGFDGEYIHFTDHAEKSEFTVSIYGLLNQYPNYKQLIPNRFNHNIVVSREKFLASLEAIKPIAKAGKENCMVTLSGSTTKSGEQDGFYLTTKALPIAGVRTEAHLKQNSRGEMAWFESGGLTVDVDYLINAIESCRDPIVTISANTETSPVVISSQDGEIHLIMPIQRREPDRSNHFSMVETLKAHFPFI